MGVCNCSMFCCTLLYVLSSIAIILMGKRELIALLNLSSWCLVMVERLFLVVPRGCLQFVIVVFLIILTYYFCCRLDILIGDNRGIHRHHWGLIYDQSSRYNNKCIRMMIVMSMQRKRVILRASWALKSEGGSVVYVYDGLNMTTWEAQWLEHRLNSEGRGIKLLIGWDFPSR